MNNFRLKNYLYSLPWLLMLFLATFSKDKQDPFAVMGEQEDFGKALIIFTYSVSLILMLINWRTILSNLTLNGRWLYLFFLLYITASTLWSDNPTSTLRISAYFWGGTVICLIAAVAFRQDPQKFFQALILYSILMVCGSLITIFINPGRGIAEGGRWIGMTAHANVLGVVSIISIWANISYMSMSKSTFIKLFNILMIFLSGVCVYGANSATSLVVSIAILVLTLMLRSFNPNRLTKLFAQLTGVCFFIFFIASILFLIYPEIFSIDAMLGMIGRDSTFTGRNVLWDMAMTKIYQHPIIGAGFQEFISTRGEVQIKHFHNGYLDLLVRGGIIALMFVIAFVFQLVYSLKRFSDPKLYVYFLIMILSILLHNVTEGSFGRGVTALWLVFSFIYFYKNDEAKTDEVKTTQPAAKYTHIIRAKIHAPRHA